MAGINSPPNASPNYWNLLSESVDRAKTTNISGIIICGDLNNDMMVPSKCRNLYDLMLNYGFSQLIEEPTYHTEHSSSLIDVTHDNQIYLHSVTHDARWC